MRWWRWASSGWCGKKFNVFPVTENGPASLILPVVSWIRVASDLGFLMIFVMLVIAELIIFGARIRRQVIRELREMENGN